MRILRSVAVFLLLLNVPVLAHEGMWLPTLLKSIEGDLQSAGLQLSAEDIYSINRSSLKDAIVLFGGGCTAEVIGREGLILTNHHCGFGAITDHSTVENDRLKNGYWAASKGEELRNPGLTATFIIRMEDVSERILPQLDPAMSEAARRDVVSRLSETIAKEATEGTHYRAVVRPFNYGNSYYLIVSETFRDVRLVGAPPSSIGKFGGDTDNWMWPRHNADMSLFRIYAGPDNKPADPADANVPFTPRHVLPMSLEGPVEGEFAMIFGFPGNTQRYLTSYAVAYVLEKADPMRVEMRTASLEVIDAAMRSSDRTRLQYADKQAGISNAWKKWIGEMRGLKELNTLARKREQEKAFNERAASAGRNDLLTVLPELEQAYGDYIPYATARDLFVEMAYYGPEVLRFADGFKGLLLEHAQLVASGKLDAEREQRLAAADAYFQNYDVAVDKRVFKALLPIYRMHMPEALAPSFLQELDARYKGDADAWVEALYDRSVFTDAGRLRNAFSKSSKGVLTKLSKDPLFLVSQSIFGNFLQDVRPQHTVLGERIEGAMRRYVKGQMDMEPGRSFWPDANSTLRLSYGRVEGSSPRDGVTYGAFTTLEGVMEKYVPGDVEFDVPPRLLELYRTKDYGPYGINGTLPVCFTSSLHTTGGNSGSPVLNGRGELIGLNFDRTWESTMSDIQFDPEKCRNICVDVRYILFLIDRYAGASHLLDEMVLAPAPAPMQLIDLPLHR